MLETVCVTLFSLRISSDVLSACLIEENGRSAGEDSLNVLNIFRGI